MSTRRPRIQSKLGCTQCKKRRIKVGSSYVDRSSRTSSSDLSSAMKVGQIAKIVPSGNWDVVFVPMTRFHSLLQKGPPKCRGLRAVLKHPTHYSYPQPSWIIYHRTSSSCISQMFFAHGFGTFCSILKWRLALRSPIRMLQGPPGVQLFLN